jgi:transposase
MKPYSEDLCTRVIDAIDQHEGSHRQIAGRFRVSLTFIERLLRRRRETGSIRPKPHGSGRLPALDENQRKQLLGLVRKQPDATLEELRQRLAVDCSLAAICRALRNHFKNRHRTIPAKGEPGMEVQPWLSRWSPMNSGKRSHRCSLGIRPGLANGVGPQSMTEPA